MHQFVSLIRDLDQALGNLEKKDLIKDYLCNALGQDDPGETTICSKTDDEWRSISWAIYFLSGEKLHGIFSTNLLKKYVLKKTNMAKWLFDQSYDSVGDLAETIAHLVCEKRDVREGQTHSLNKKIRSFTEIKNQDDDQKIHFLMEDFDHKSFYYIFTICKLFTGGFRLGISRLQIAQVIAEICRVKKELIASRLILFFNDTYPNIGIVKNLFSERFPISQRNFELDIKNSIPLPFFLSQNLSSQIEDDFFRTYKPHDWIIEWKWDGIRIQLLVKIDVKTQRKDIQLWTRGEEFVTEKFSGLIRIAEQYITEDVVLDGELLVWDFDRNLPKKFSSIQKIFAKKSSRSSEAGKDLAGDVIFMVYDILSTKNTDLRGVPLEKRKKILGQFQKNYSNLDQFMLSPIFLNVSHQKLNQLRNTARENRVEGVMIKRKNGLYGVGRTKGKTGYDSYKWKINPLSADAVIIYAQKGHGIRSGIFSDYTFAVYNDEKDPQELVPFAKAYSGLSNSDIKTIDKKIKKIIEESYGPVKKVRPEIVIELHFDSISESKRHKSGIAVRFPRMKRIRLDKTLNDIDKLSNLKKLI